MNGVIVCANSMPRGGEAASTGMVQVSWEPVRGGQRGIHRFDSNAYHTI